MKRIKYAFIIGVLAVSVVGCSKNNDNVTIKEGKKIVTDTSDNESVVSSTIQDNRSGITKILGTKSTTSKNVVVVNNTGRTIREFYARIANADAWGTNLLATGETLADQEKAIFYYEPGDADLKDRFAVLYDFRAECTESDSSTSRFLFSAVPVLDIDEVTFNIEGTVPYVSYISLFSKTEASTLEAETARTGNSFFFPIPTEAPATATPTRATQNTNRTTTNNVTATPTQTPDTPTPEPVTPTPEPVTPTPEPVTPTPEPETPTPEPETPTPEPDTPTPEPTDAGVDEVADNG
ncbi:MAG: hypothetical protein ACK5MN_11395 [Lachnospiraceae bacterium]